MSVTNPLGPERYHLVKYDVLEGLGPSRHREYLIMDTSGGYNVVDGYTLKQRCDEAFMTAELQRLLSSKE